VVRQRLESRGLQAQATVTTYRFWVDDMSHHDVTYLFVAGGQEHTRLGQRQPEISGRGVDRRHL
jgi:hypothetical protein